MEYFYGVMHQNIICQKYSNFKEEHEEYFRAVLIHLFENHNTFNIFQYSTELGNFMCKYRNGLRPLSFDHVFTELESNYKYNTKHKTNFRHKVHKIKTIFLPQGQKHGSFKKAISSFLEKNGLVLCYFVPLKNYKI